MYAIETELGRFEADTEREAKKAMRAAKAKAERDRKLKNHRRQIASERAKATAFDVMNRVLSGEPCPCGWRYYPAGHKHACRAKREPSSISGYPRSTITVRTKYGEVAIPDWYVRLMGSVMNGAEWDILLYVDNGDDELCVAVGVCEGVYAIETIHGIPSTWFIGGSDDA